MPKRSRSSPAAKPAALRIPINVIGLSPGGREIPVPVWTGLPLARSAVTSVAALRLLDGAGQPVPAQFDVQATWSNGSIKWVLVSFFASAERNRFTVTTGGAEASPLPDRPVGVRVDTNRWDVTTGVLKFMVNRHGFGGIGQAMLDLDGDGQFASDDLVAPETDRSGIVAADEGGRTFTSRLGRTARMELERAGPVHAVVAVHGDLRDGRDGEPLLDYAVRIHAFAGSALLRVVVTVRNPRPSGRADDGARWTLGQSGAVLLKSLEFVLPVRLPEGHRRVTMSPEPGKVLERIPLTGPVGVYQDSSGGENWFHRAHANRDDLVPLSFRGYRSDYHGRPIETGLRATPWLEVADMRWAVGAAVPLFWQNFPKALWADGDGTIRVALWPGQFADLHEIQGGEQKTHEFWVYFRHRRGPRESLMPLGGEVLPVCLMRPRVWAAPEAYLAPGVFLPFPPRRPGRFEKYEAVVAAAVRGTENLLTHRERADEYGWRHFGDTPARNERDQTQGPYHGQSVVSHYNNEYDLGLGMLMQALRNTVADPVLAAAWWDLAMQALWHEADIDIYHTAGDPAPIYNGGTFTHTSHGVDAGRSTHRGSPHDVMWGRLDWPWQRGSTPEAGHLRTGGIIHAALLTGDRHLLDAAWEVANLVAFKIRTDQFAQVHVPDRSGGHNLQILLDAWLLTWDSSWLDLCDRLVSNLTPESVSGRTGEGALDKAGWGSALYIKALSRFIDALAEKGVRHATAIESHLAYARALLAGYHRGGWRTGPWSLLMSEVMMQAAELTGDAAERKEFLAAAGDAFRVNDRHVAPDGSAPFWNSKSTTMLLQGGGRYMLRAEDRRPRRRPKRNR